MPSKKKRPPPLDLQIVEEDDLKRVVTVSTKKKPQDDQSQTKKKKRGPYDPEVYHTIETIRQEVEEEIRKKPSKRKRELEDDDALAQQLDEAIQQMTVIDEKVEAVKEKTEGEVAPKVCPFHIELLVNIKNAKGYQLMKCSEQLCLISIVDENNIESYMEGAYNKVHQDIQDRWHTLLCTCGHLPSLRQSRSEKNPGRMYLACRNHECRYFKWADEPLPFPQNPSDIMVCPCHCKKMELRTSQQGWEYMKCPGIPCLLMCGKDNAANYMSAVHKDVHPDICDRWEKMNCFCGHYPIMKQSFSDKNPGRLYLSCGDNKKCKFFRWADEPVLKENFKDPLSIHDWLQDSIPAADPPPIYGESVQQAQRRLMQTQIDTPELKLDYVPLHKDVIERGKLGLF